MAANTTRITSAVKITAFVCSVPLAAIGLGYKLRYEQAKEAYRSGAKPVSKATDLPLYTAMKEEKVDLRAPYPSNPLEEGVSLFRKAVQEFLETCTPVKTVLGISIDGSREALQYIQSNPQEVLHAAIVASAGIGAFILGHKSGPWKRMTYTFLATVPCALICYPKRMMELNEYFMDYVTKFWSENDGTKNDDDPDSPVLPAEGEHLEPPEKKIPVLVNSDSPKIEDMLTTLEFTNDQSNPEDKDLYSTRST